MVLYLCVVAFPVADLTRNWCVGAGVIIILMNLMVSACGEGLVIYVLCCSWNWKRGITWMLIIGWSLVLIMGTVSLALCAAQFSKNNTVSFLPLGSIRTCNVTHVPSEYLRAFYFNTAMELYLIAFLVLNVLSRPRTVSEGILGMLVNDGLVFFLITFPSKIANLIVISKAPTSIAIIFPMFTMALISTSTGRLYLRFCSAWLELERVDVDVDLDVLYDEVPKKRLTMIEI